MSSSLGEEVLAACLRGDVERLQELRHEGESLSAADNDGRQPIHFAARDGRLSVVEWLHKQGVPLSAADNDGIQPIHYAAKEGHLEVVQFLCFHGAARTPPTAEHYDSIESNAFEQPAVLAWLQHTRDYTTPLHHLELLSAAHARDLLRAGAALEARARPDAPSPLELARQLQQHPDGGAAPGSEAARLVVAAAQPWSPQTHELWPSGGRAHAKALVRLGWRLSNTQQSPGPFGNEAEAVMDTWRGIVMVHALERADFEA